MTTGCRVAVLGAYGAVGRHLVPEAKRLGHLVTAVGRRAEQLRAIAADAHEVGSIGDRVLLARLGTDHDVVINATGVEDAEAAGIVTDAGAAYADISADADHLLALEALQPPRPVAAGIGLAPGLTNLLAAAAAEQVTDRRPLHISIVGSVGEAHGAAGRSWIWESAGCEVRSGPVPERVYRARRRVDVAGLGRRTIWRAAFGEQDQLRRDLGRPVSTWLGLDPAWAGFLLGVAGFVPRSVGVLDHLSRPVARLWSGRDGWWLAVDDGRRCLVSANGRSQSRATAVMAALAVTPLVAAAAGAVPAHRLLTLAEVRDALTRRGITVHSALPQRS